MPWWKRQWVKVLARVAALMSVVILMLAITATHFDSSEVRSSLGITAVLLVREILGVKVPKAV